MKSIGYYIGFAGGFVKGFFEGFTDSIKEAYKKEREVKEMIRKPFNKDEMSIEAIAGAYGIGEAMRIKKLREEAQQKEGS